MLPVSRQGFYKYLRNRNRQWKYQPLADAMLKIQAEDECNDTCGRIRMYQALRLKQIETVRIPSERTVCRVMEEIKSSNGKLYVSAIFDCFHLSVLGLAMDTNQKAPLCVQTLENAYKAYPSLRGAVIHSGKGTPYTSQIYRNAIRQYGIRQSMNSAGGRCHDNARCESIWARMKSELLYDRYSTEKMTTDERKVLIWIYFISYWNNQRICSANEGLPPMVKRQQYYDSLKKRA